MSSRAPISKLHHHCSFQKRSCNPLGQYSGWLYIARAGPLAAWIGPSCMHPWDRLLQSLNVVSSGILYTHHMQMQLHFHMCIFPVWIPLCFAGSISLSLRSLASFLVMMRSMSFLVFWIVRIRYPFNLRRSCGSSITWLTYTARATRGPRIKWLTTLLMLVTRLIGFGFGTILRNLHWFCHFACA